MTTQALIHQGGPDHNYMHPNWTASLGNDDQAFWGHAAMSAAEKRFPDPPIGQPQWLSMAQAVFNNQAERWEDRTCGGGLRWQIFSFNKGYDYKNSVSNGAFFLLAARLARYTGNSTYSQWAERTYEWSKKVGFVDEKYMVWDGANVENQCNRLVKNQWSYNAGFYLAGAAYMYNIVCVPIPLNPRMSRICRVLTGDNLLDKRRPLLGIPSPQAVGHHC